MATSIIGTPVTGEASGTYITQADIEGVFGTSNIQKWSQLDNDSEIANVTRIALAITYAEERIDNRFRNSRYVVPFSTVPAELKDWCAKIAGIWLYQNRGQQDESEEGDKMENLRKGVEQTISFCLANGMKLNATQHDTSVPTAPTMVVDNG